MLDIIILVAMVLVPLLIIAMPIYLWQTWLHRKTGYDPAMHIDDAGMFNRKDYHKPWSYNADAIRTRKSKHTPHTDRLHELELQQKAQLTQPRLEEQLIEDETAYHLADLLSETYEAKSPL